MDFLDADELEAGLPKILASPKDSGIVRMIVRRPSDGEREVMNTGELSLSDGLVGDNWRSRGSGRTDDGSAHPEMQLNLMNARVIALVAQTEDRWALAGDQLFVDLDLSKENLPAGTRLELGSTIVEVTAVPHLGCKKFVSRFGVEAMKFVNSRRGKTLCLRGINAKVVKPGRVSTGDRVRKMSLPSH
ncbi:MAG: hypothetical protein OXL68_19060 [Paracoccaceae bacterium]|nr:hypothetical protein [Paracoccaceae bacterium]